MFGQTVASREGKKINLVLNRYVCVCMRFYIRSSLSIIPPEDQPARAPRPKPVPVRRPIWPWEVPKPAPQPSPKPEWQPLKTPPLYTYVWH